MDKERDRVPEDVEENAAQAAQDEAAHEAAADVVNGKVVDSEIVGEEPAAEKGAEEELEALRTALDEARAKEAEYLDGWQRARAELANARKRFQRAQEQAYANARADVLTGVLPVIDDFERAVNTLPENLAKSDWINGVLLIRRKLELLLDQSGVVPIQAVGEEFDPVLHQAVTHEPSETVPEGHVIDEMQKGYRVGERVLRPSMVRVSSGPAEAEARGETDTEAEKEPAS